MTKLQITLTDQEAGLLRLKASSLGYSLTKFVKFLLGQKALEYDMDVPSFKMSKKTERVAAKAIKDYKAGRTYSVDSIEELDQLIRQK